MARLPQADPHEYVRGDVDGRGPCPVLKALANHGYLPRDGRNVTPARVRGALGEALGMTSLAAASSDQLAKVVGVDGTFDLRHLRQNPLIENDRSFTRRDFRHGGDNYTLQPDMLRAMLDDDARGGPLTARTLARTYRRRRSEHRASGGEPLTAEAWAVNLVQSISLLNAAQVHGQLPRQTVETLYLDERLPDEMLVRTRRPTLAGLAACLVRFVFHVYLWS